MTILIGPSGLILVAISSSESFLQFLPHFLAEVVDVIKLNKIGVESGVNDCIIEAGLAGSDGRCDGLYSMSTRDVLMSVLIDKLFALANCCSLHC